MENNQGQGAASEAGRPVGAAHAISPHVFRLLPSDLIRSPLSLSASVCVSLNFWPRDPVGASPTCPLALKNRLTKNMAHSHRPIQNPPVTSYVNRSVCVRRVCVTAYLCRHRRCVESQSAEATASALHSLSGSQTSLR